MAEIHAISADSRKDEGKGASRRLRRAGYVPAIVYGGGQDPQNIQLEHRIVLALAKNEWFFSSVLDLTVDGKTQKVLLRDWQKHPFKPLMMHMDFQRINENEQIRTSVPLHFLNQETSPAGKASGVVISHNITEVEVSCLAKDLPEFIEVDLAALDKDDIVHLSDLKLPAGVTLSELSQGKEHDLPVVTAHAVRAVVEEEPAAEGGEGEAEAGNGE